MLHNLNDRLIQILDRASRAEGFQAPKFKLGPDEPPQTQQKTETLAWLKPTQSLSSLRAEIRDIFEKVSKGPSKLDSHWEYVKGIHELQPEIQKVRKDAQKDPNALTSHEKMILLNHLSQTPVNYTSAVTGIKLGIEVPTH
jgi:hypothetical protein